MFSFQSEQAEECKNTEIAELQEKLTGALIGLARATEGNDHMVTDSTAAAIVEGLLATRVDANIDKDALLAIIERADIEKRKLVPECYNCASSCGRTNNYDMRRLLNLDVDVRSLKYRILSGIRSMAVQIDHAAMQGYRDDSIHQFLYKALFSIGMDDWGMEELLPIVQEMDEVSRKCKALTEKGSS